MMHRLIERISSLSRTLVVAYGLFVISALLLVAVLIYTMRVDVLTDWKIIIPAGDFRAGDTLAVQSTYRKLVSANGKATRYLECKNIGDSGIYVRFPINEANADRPAGDKGIAFLLKLPDDVPDLPATCRLSINIDYRVYPWRTVSEYTTSRDFTLLPSLEKPRSSEPVTEPVVESPLPTQTNQDQAQSTGGSGENPNDSLPAQSAPTVQPTQPETSQPPSIAEQIANWIKETLK